MKRIFLSLLSIITISQTYGQSISLHFPHFAGQEWYITAFAGEGKDTIATGQLDEQGKAKILLPAKFQGHRGMVQWLLRQGGGLDMIVTEDENFSVSCLDAQPSEKNIIYKNSIENNYLNPRYYRQQAILGKVEAMHAAKLAYEEDIQLSSVFKAELNKQEEAYHLLQQETSNNSSLYAAKFAQIVDLTRGLSLNGVFYSPEEFEKELNDFVLTRLDMNVLYTSGHWTRILDQFMASYLNKDENKPLFVKDAIRLLNRIESDEVYNALAEKVVATCEKHNMYDQELEFAFFLLNDDKIKEPKGRIASLYTLLKIRKGAKAPALAQGTLPKKKTILAFYDSSCKNCTDQMNKLVELYPQLKKKGYEIISLSSDSDKGMFDYYSNKLPWKSKYYDPEGFAGKDFINYGIIGTPTFYVLDKRNIIQGRYASIEDVKL